ncbi:MAG TPA: hypothetical protein VKX46_19000 [Ktedonobacteraceae bacterium]|nr:hypothetical protein [Ktedonobacteraceae bacterium]
MPVAEFDVEQAHVLGERLLALFRYTRQSCVLAFTFARKWHGNTPRACDVLAGRGR